MKFWLSSGLTPVWRHLVDAPAAITDPERRQRIRLLSGLLVVLIPLGYLSLGIQLLLFPGIWPTFVSVSALLALLFVAYGLARAGHYTVGALIGVGVTAIAAFVIVLLNPADAFNHAFLFISILLTALLFAETGVWIVAMANLFGASVLLPAWGVPPPDNDPLVAPIFIVIVTALLLLGIRHRNVLERDRQVELAASETRFRSFVDATLEGVVFIENGCIIDINERGAVLVGAASSAALIGRPILDFCAPADRERVAMQMRNNVTTPYEFTVRRVDGSEFPAEVCGHTSLYHNRPVRVTVVHDLTERKRGEQRTQQLNRLLQTLGSINPALVGAGTEPQLFANICRTLVEQGGFAMAWVGLVEPDTQRVRVACQSGFAHGYLENLDIRCDDSPQGQGPTGMAIRTGRTVSNDDTETNTLFAPWRERAHQHGYRSTVAIPLRIHGQAIGSLNVYAAQPHAFGEEEVVLLEKLAGDVGMAVERQRAIDRIAASEHELATILQNMQDTYYRTDQDGRIVRASESATKLLGYAPDDVLGMRLADFYVDADGRERFLAALQSAGGSLRNYEAALQHRDGSVIWVSTNAQYVRAADGRVIGIEGTTRDISDRKRAEDRLLDIARGVSATTGEEFFHSLVAHLVQSLHADYAFVGQLVPGQADRIRTIAVQAADRHVEDFEYDLAGTPCQNVVGRGTCAYPHAVQEQFPGDHMLVEMGVQAYVGTPLFGSNGAALGLLVVLYRRPIDQHDQTIRSTLEIFAARVAAELERVRAEQSLHDSEVMLARAQEMTHLGSWTWQVASGQVTWSDEMYRIYGVSPDAGEVSFERAMAAIHPDDRKFVAQQVQDMLAGKDTENYECRIVRPNGVERNVWARSEVQRAADGSPQLVIGTVQDITGRKRAEQALRDSEARLRTVVSNAPVVLYTLDRDGVIQLSEGRGLAVLQLKPGEAVGRSVFEMYRDYPEIVSTIRRALAGESVVHVVTLGSLTFEVHYSPTFDSDGAVESVIGLAIDISARKQAENALIQSESNFRALTENANVGILVNHHGKHVFANNRLLDMLGYTADEIRETGVKELVHPLEYDKVMACFRDRLAGKPAPGVYETVFMTKAGQAVPVELTAARTNWQGEPAGLVFLHDIRERLRTDEQMRKLSSALEQTADSVVITDRAGIIEYVNPGFEKTTGYSRDEALGQTPRLVKSGKQGAGFYKKLWGTILAGEVFNEVFVNRRKDGSLYYEEKTISPLKGPAGQVTHFVATGKDVTERMQTQERLQHMAQHDALTELPNRLLFMDRLKQSLARARWHERLVAVLFVDMDRFKNINDTLGHETGDRLLQALAERLTSSVREGDTVARFGGDEFVILLDDVASDKDIGALAQKVIEMLAPPFEIDDQSLYITASIGVSLYPNDGEDSTTLIKNADIAMYRAKDLGKNTYQFYSPDMSARAFERLTLESSLRHAIERNEFRLYYQPQIDTANGAILGVEALLRWQHPDFGLVAPAEFIPLLEETGLIVPVGEWVFNTACEQLCAWHAAGWPTLRMAVNLSPRQFQAAGLAMMVERGLAMVGCDPGLIELEITENVLLRHAAATLDALDALRALGVRMAIDDFGTGYSSLSYLRRYSIDTLKIDRSFVHDVPGDADDSALASAIIVLAQSLKLDVIAEGVETGAQRDFLRERGCHLMQGYLFSRPVPADELTALLGKQPDQSRG